MGDRALSLATAVASALGCALGCACSPVLEIDGGVPVQGPDRAVGRAPWPSIDAKVLAVRRVPGIVMLSAGSDDGVKVGQRFTIFRGDSFVGKVEVQQVFEDMCSAKILPDWRKEKIMPNDNAAAPVWSK